MAMIAWTAFEPLQILFLDVVGAADSAGRAEFLVICSLDPSVLLKSDWIFYEFSRHLQRDSQAMWLISFKYE